MGWLHVIRSGKGFYLNGMGDIGQLKLDQMKQYVCSKETVKKMAEEELPLYDSLTDINKIILLGYVAGRPYIYEFKEKTPVITNEMIEKYFDEYDKRYCFISALGTMFAEHHGYPTEAFRSCLDYNEDAMIFCNVMYPPTVYDEALSKLTESVYRDQLAEFCYNLTGDERYRDYELEVCEEYVKE